MSEAVLEAALPLLAVLQMMLHTLYLEEQVIREVCTWRVVCGGANLLYTWLTMVGIF